MEFILMGNKGEKNESFMRSTEQAPPPWEALNVNLRSAMIQFKYCARLNECFP